MLHGKANMVKGADTATITIEQGSPFKRGWGPTLQCKISDATGEIISHKCEVSRRAVWAKD